MSGTKAVWRSTGRAIDDLLMPWQEIRDDFTYGGILIGNGFSQAVWKKFGYSSIYEAASSDDYTNHPLTLEDKRVFELLRTTNFEMVLSHLSWTSKINKALNKESSYLDERYEHIKTALGEAIRSVHVPWIQMPEEVLKAIRSELLSYKFVYSTNYDLLPCWATMLDGKGTGFKDYFWAPNPDNPSGDRCFDIADSCIIGNPTRIFYLHGALHLYKNPFTGRTHKFKNRIESSLLDISEIPLFITEGSSEDKLQAIRNSDYLFFSYNQLLNHSGSLVVFGHSLGSSDNHLIAAIRVAARRGNIKKIAISIRNSNSSNQIVQRKANLNCSLCEGLPPQQRPELVFFDSETHPLGSSSIRVQEETNYLSSLLSW